MLGRCSPIELGRSQPCKVLFLSESSTSMHCLPLFSRVLHQHFSQTQAGWGQVLALVETSNRSPVDFPLPSEERRETDRDEGTQGTPIKWFLQITADI